MKTSKRLVAKAILALVGAVAFSQAALAVEVAGVQFEERIQVAGKELKLNGAGLRTKVIVKVYALALYLAEPKRTVREVLAVQGPRRISLVMLRDISSQDLGQAFMSGLNQNSDQEHIVKILPQTMQFGELFSQVPRLKKGDVMEVDWVPEVGTQVYINARKIGTSLQDVNFYNAILRIWLGEKAVDGSLKPKLLGEG